MKAHISGSQTELDAAIKANLLKVRQAGIAAGAKAISHVIYEIANDSDRTLEKRIEDINKFCKVGLGIGEKEKAKS